MAAEEEWAGRGTVPGERGRDSGSAAEEWAGVVAGREVRAREAEAREREARAEAAVRVRAEVCGTPALAEARVPEAGRVVAQARVRDRELAEAELAAVPGLDRAEVAGGVVLAEVGERELDRVGVAALGAGGRGAGRVVAAAERVRVWAEEEQVLVPVGAEDLVAEVVRVPGLEREEVGLEPAERQRRENG